MQSLYTPIQLPPAVETLTKEAGLVSSTLKWFGKAAPAASKAELATKAPGIMSHVGSLFGFSSAPNTIGSRLYSPLRLLGGFKQSPAAAAFRRDVAMQAGGWGTLSGTLNAMQADPGDRLKSFGRGFATGAIGGAAWSHGTNLAKKGLVALTKGRTGEFAKILRAKASPEKLINGEIVPPSIPKINRGEQGWGANLARRVGAGAVTTTATLGAGLGLNELANTAGKRIIPNLYVDETAPVPRAITQHGMRVIRSHGFGLTPQAQQSAYTRVPAYNNMYALSSNYPAYPGASMYTPY